MELNLIDTAGLRNRIETGYALSGNGHGWRFLYSNASVLHAAKVAIIGLNPGGDEQIAEHGEFDVPAGTSAYIHESWKDFPAGSEPLQLQIRALCGWLSVEPQNVLAGNFVPWRSRSWQTLVDRKGAIEFGLRLWSDIFKAVEPRLIIAIGLDTGRHVAKALEMPAETKVSVGWGNYPATAATNGKQRLIAFPHLSRFRIMDRPKSREALENLFQSL